MTVCFYENHIFEGLLFIFNRLKKDEIDVSEYFLESEGNKLCCFEPD